MGIDLYFVPSLSSSQPIIIVAKALGLELNLKEIDFSKGDHKTPEFLKLNPQHSIPTLVDNGFSVWESRAIMQYLCDKYDNGGKFYPKDPESRANVNRLLYFDLGTFYKAIMGLYTCTADKADPIERKKKVTETLEILDGFLNGRKWLVGNQLTIADLSIVANMLHITPLNFDLSPFPNILKWLETCKKEILHYDVIEKSYEVFDKFIKENYKEVLTLFMD